MEEEIVAVRFRTAYWALVHNLDALRLHIWEARGITLPQLRVLLYLRANPGATTNALAKTLGLTAPTVSGLVEKLVDKGWVERGQHPTDRRIIPLTLTESGAEIVGEIRQVNHAYLFDLAHELGDDLEPLTQALERLGEVIARRPARAVIDPDGAHS